MKLSMEEFDYEALTCRDPLPEGGYATGADL